MNHKFQKYLLLVALTFALFGTAQSADRIGEAEFRKNCAVCHGAAGHGDGPIIDMLKQAPSDLTQLRINNGGKFPAQRVYDTIIDAGRTRAHGDREMPIWGDRYSREVIAAEGEFGMGSHDAVRARVLELVFFLSTIQE